MIGHEEDDMKGSAEFKKEDSHIDPTDLKQIFGQFAKERRITLNKKDEGKYGRKI